MSSSVANFNDSMAEITLELDDREIYNDIRSAIDITETVDTLVVDSPDVYAEAIASHHEQGESQLGETRTVTLTTDWGRKAVSWSAPVAFIQQWDPIDKDRFPDAYALGVRYLFTDSWGASSTMNSSSPNEANVVWVNDSGHVGTNWGVDAKYRYLKIPQVAHVDTTTGTVTQTVRAVDLTSVALYGRRVMNLDWPVGQSKEAVISLATAYLNKHRAAMPRLNMTIVGSSDELMVQLLQRRISDLVTITNARLGLNADCFINAVNYSHAVGGLPQAMYQLEAARLMETSSLFVLDNSSLDGSDRLG
jgi:hypothetical protein